MSKSQSTFSAGNAGASTFINLNGNLGGGNKKQGLPPSIGRISDLEYGRSYGAERNVVFNINQIGGVGRGKSMFQSNADGVYIPNSNIVTSSNVLGETVDSSSDTFVATDLNIQSAVDAYIAGAPSSTMTDFLNENPGTTSAEVMNISNWSTSQVTSMTGLFDGKTSFNADIGSWDVSGVLDMSYMFQDAISFNQDIREWTISSDITDMSYMFQGATSFIQDIRVWTVLESGGEYVANISSMFLNATLMLNEYNRNMVPDPTEPGTPGSTTNAAGYAFFNASDIYTPPTTKSLNLALKYIYDGGTSSGVTTTDFNNLAGQAQPYCTVDALYNVSTWNVKYITALPYAFSYNAVFDDITKWNVSNVTNMFGMFEDAHQFNQDISVWDMSNVLEVNYMFMGASSFNYNLDAWNLKITGSNMQTMFAGASKFNQDISWDMSSVTDMTSMFNGATAFNGNISKWDVSSVTNMPYMFNGASAFNVDISNWDVSSITNMNNMFNGAIAFNQDIRKWKVSESAMIGSMFKGATEMIRIYGDYIDANGTPLPGFFTGT